MLEALVLSAHRTAGFDRRSLAVPCGILFSSIFES